MVTLLTPTGLPYEESARQTVSVRPAGISITRYVQFDGGLEMEYAREFLGYSEFDLGNRRIIRHPPMMHPKWPGATDRNAGEPGLGLPAMSFEFVRELGEPTQNANADNVLTFETVEYAVTYERSEENHGVWYLSDLARPGGQGVNGQKDESWRYVHRRMEYEAHGIGIPRNVLEFVAPLAGPHDPVPDPGVQLVHESTLYLTWFGIPADTGLGDGEPRLPGNLEENIGKCILRVNQFSFLFLPALTAIALAPKRTLRTQADGSLVWDIVYPIAVRGGPDLSDAANDGLGTAMPDWTRLIRQDGKYWKVRRKAAPTKSIYDVVDLYWLFRTDATP
jgi:hypothetical protein